MAEEEMTDDQALMKIVGAMKESGLTPDEKHNIHTFLNKVAVSKDTTKTANLRADKDVDELGLTSYTVRGAKQMALISEDIMNNDFFKKYFNKEAEITTSTSLGREGFLIRQGTTQTKQVADITKRRKINKGWFGKQKIEEQGGDTQR